MLKVLLFIGLSLTGMIFQTFAVGSCSSFSPQNSCACSCGSTCNYYTFSNGTSTLEITEIPFDISGLVPTGQYCDFEGESGLTSLTELPFTIGSETIDELPFTVSLAYKIPSLQTRSCAPCPVPTPTGTPSAP
jgi:hypothetical protein